MSTCDLCEAEEIDCDRMVPELLSLRSRVAELEEALAVAQAADCGGEPGDDLDLVAQVSLGLCRRARRALGMGVKP